MSASTATDPGPSNTQQHMAVSDGSSPAGSRTVVVLGVSYGGAYAAKLLAAGLPAGWRVVAIDRNSHMNHVYVFPRCIALPEHAPKAFPPYGNLFNITPPEPSPSASADESAPKAVAADHVFVQGEVTQLSRNAVTVTLANADGTYNGALRSKTIPFAYCVYALGAALPRPCDVWGEVVTDAGRGTKRGAVAWMERESSVLAKAERILVIGGGALGIQFSTDIKDLYPAKHVTLLHSRTRLLPRYPEEMHDAIIAALQRTGVETVLGERVVSWPENPGVLDGKEKRVRTDKGHEFVADLVLVCTGQKPHVALMRDLDARTVNPTSGRICVRPTTQVSRCRPRAANSGVTGAVAAMSIKEDAASKTAAAAANDTDLDHIFAVGDCADTTAIQAGHTSYYQAEVAAKNIIKLVERSRRRKGVPGGHVASATDEAASQAERATQPNAEEMHDNDDEAIVEAEEAVAEAADPDDALETYTPTPPMIKLTLGIKHYATAMPEGVKTGDDGIDDLQARAMWGVFHADGFADDD